MLDSSSLLLVICLLPTITFWTSASILHFLGANKDYVPQPWFWSDQYDVKLQIAGLNTGYDRIVTRVSGTARSHWYFRGDSFLAVDAMNDPRAYMVGKRMLEQGITPDPTALENPETELKTLLK